MSRFDRVLSRDQRHNHYAEFRGWLEDRYAEYARTSTVFR